MLEALDARLDKQVRKMGLINVAKPKKRKVVKKRKKKNGRKTKKSKNKR